MKIVTCLQILTTFWISGRTNVNMASYVRHMDVSNGVVTENHVLLTLALALLPALFHECHVIS
jgi:hypothetical protein